MISFFVKEQKRYTQEELKKLFQCDSNKIAEYIRKLKQFNVLKAVKNTQEQLNFTELIEDDVEVEETEPGQSDYLYVFTFVGVITAFERVLKCYPKYIDSTDQPLEELKVVLEVLEKYNSKEQIIKMYNETDETSSFNLLAVMLYLLHDFNENGLYSNSTDTIEVNGAGEILWDKTINESFTFISNTRPYYMEVYTQKRLNDELDYFKRLHEAILTICSHELKKAGLADLFAISPVELTDEEISDFGDQDEILYRLYNELNVQFNTRKQLLLKTLYAVVSQNNHLSDIDSFSMFGTNSFHTVWEKICSEVFNNQLETEVRNLPISLPTIEPNDKLIDLIEKPKWWHDENGYLVAKSTLIPDIVSMEKISNRYRFFIFDAKYYKLVLTSEKLNGQPGVGDVTKQYLYQLAFSKITDDVEISEVRNCFLLPTESDEVINKGRVSMDMLGNLGLESIQIRELPVKEVYSHYLHNKKFDLRRLGL